MKAGFYFEAASLPSRGSFLNSWCKIIENGNYMKSLNYALVSSLCALVIGVLLVAWPDMAVNYLVITVGVLFLIPGLVGVFSYFSSVQKRRREGVRVMFPVVALGSALFGIWLVLMPAFFVTIFMYVLGVLLLLGGLSQLSEFVAARSYVRVPAGMYVFPVLVMAAGLVVLFNPFEAAMLPFMVLGVSFIVYSLIDIVRLVRFRRKTAVPDIQDVTPIEETKE